ncbi:MAG: transporter [Deltaproteobacteria bacterium]|nr:transporter [Deltaproteobacteria bacterium]
MRGFLYLLGFLMITTVAFAGHPLATDDAGTSGKGKGQVEIGVSFFEDKDDADEAITMKAKGGEIAIGFAVGVLEMMDVVMGVPYVWYFVDENGVRVEKANGLSDISFDVKWCLFEKDGWVLALKPGVSLPSGDEDNGLGAGRADWRIFFIGTKEFEPAALHVNVGCLRNENKTDERLNLWHASLAAEVEVVRRLKLMANICVERSPEKGSDNHPSFALGGISYDVSERVTIDAGVKIGLTDPADDVAYLTGITVKF